MSQELKNIFQNELQTELKSTKMKRWIAQGAIPIYEGHVSLVQYPYEGKKYDVIVSSDACAMLYIDTQDKVWFTSQYRVPMRKEILELPAETLDKVGESVLERVIGGLEEECGIEVSPSQLEFVMSVGSSEGHDTEMVHLYIAKGEHKYVGQKLDEHEKISIKKIPFYDAYDMMRAGELQGSKTAILLQHEYISRLHR